MPIDEHMDEERNGENGMEIQSLEHEASVQWPPLESENQLWALLPLDPVMLTFPSGDCDEWYELSDSSSGEGNVGGLSKCSVDSEEPSLDTLVFGVHVKDGLASTSVLLCYFSQLETEPGISVEDLASKSACSEIVDGLKAGIYLSDHVQNTELLRVHDSSEGPADSKIENKIWLNSNFSAEADTSWLWNMAAAEFAHPHRIERLGTPLSVDVNFTELVCEIAGENSDQIQKMEGTNVNWATISSNLLIDQPSALDRKEELIDDVGRVRKDRRFPVTEERVADVKQRYPVLKLYARNGSEANPLEDEPERKRMKPNQASFMSQGFSKKDRPVLQASPWPAEPAEIAKPLSLIVCDSSMSESTSTMSNGHEDEQFAPQALVEPTHLVKTFAEINDTFDESRFMEFSEDNEIIVLLEKPRRPDPIECVALENKETTSSEQPPLIPNGIDIQLKVPHSMDERSFSRSLDHEQLDLTELMKSPAKSGLDSRSRSRRFQIKICKDQDLHTIASTTLADRYSEDGEKAIACTPVPEFWEVHGREIKQRYKALLLYGPLTQNGTATRDMHTIRSRHPDLREETEVVEEKAELYCLRYWEEFCGTKALYDLELIMDIHKLALSKFQGLEQYARADTTGVGHLRYSKDIEASFELYDGPTNVRIRRFYVPAFDEYLRKPQLHAYVRYYIWHERGKKLMHSHFRLRKVMKHLRGWRFEHENPESSIACYRYTMPGGARSKQQQPEILFGLAWPYLLDTPPVYLLHFVDFVNRSQARYGEKVFVLREYVPSYVQFSTNMSLRKPNLSDGTGQLQDERGREHELVAGHWDVDGELKRWILTISVPIVPVPPHISLGEQISISRNENDHDMQRMIINCNCSWSLQLPAVVSTFHRHFLEKIDSVESSGERQSSPVMIENDYDAKWMYQSRLRVSSYLPTGVSMFHRGFLENTEPSESDGEIQPSQVMNGHT